ncbi:MAG TPA: hypothetical protein VMJ30_01315 [Gemmatimonadales bacterium]|nr:hypothetical protein [Gemmatimonadales bacterium]
MPKVSVLLIRSALIWLVLGAGLGSSMLASTTAAPAGWWRAHGELMLIGWCLQLAMGVAYWILPKHAAGAARGNVWLAAAIAPLLNAGIALSLLGWLALVPDRFLDAARGLELLAILAFALVIAPRIKPFGAGRSMPGSRSPSA